MITLWLIIAQSQFTFPFFFKFVLQDPALVDELRDNLMSCGIKLFDKRSFKEAAEYFTEVVRLVCEFNFVREAYVYQAKCHFEMVSYLVAIHNCRFWLL